LIYFTSISCNKECRTMSLSLLVQIFLRIEERYLDFALLFEQINFDDKLNLQKTSYGWVYILYEPCFLNRKIKAWGKLHIHKTIYHPLHTRVYVCTETHRVFKYFSYKKKSCKIIFQHTSPHSKTRKI